LNSYDGRLNKEKRSSQSMMRLSKKYYRLLLGAVISTLIFFIFIFRINNVKI
jgi:hypothetical protein